MAEPVAGAEQPLVGFLSNDEWEDLLADLNQRIEHMEALPDGEHKNQVFALLNGIDAMHREALQRLVRLFKEGVLEKVVSDPAIHTLMELYDLLPASAAPAGSKPAFPTIPIRPLAGASPAKPLRFPHWVPASIQTDDASGTELHDDLLIDGLPLLLARRNAQWFAVAGACPVDGASMQGAQLSGFTLSCPNHAGCHYDIRSGARIGGGAGISCYPIRSDEQGRLMVGLDMDFSPALPSF